MIEQYGEVRGGGFCSPGSAGELLAVVGASFICTWKIIKRQIFQYFVRSFALLVGASFKELAFEWL